MELEIVGLKIHHNIGKKVIGHNCEFSHIKTTITEYIVCLESDQTKKYELKMWIRYGECPSGWTTAQWAEHQLLEVSHFGAMTHLINNECKKTILYDQAKLKYQCEYFSYSYDGDDRWYPEGQIYVNMEKFKKFRGFDRHPVWVFTGQSGLGKSFLAHHLSKMIIFETDSVDQLPNEITADIVVLGNKHKYSKTELEKRIEGELIYVEFTKV